MGLFDKFKKNDNAQKQLRQQIIDSDKRALMRSADARVENVEQSENPYIVLFLALNGSGAYKLENRPGYGHRYDHIIRAIYRYDEKNPQFNIEKHYIDALRFICEKISSTYESSSKFFLYIIEELGNQKEGISPFKRDTYVQILESFMEQVKNRPYMFEDRQIVMKINEYLIYVQNNYHCCKEIQPISIPDEDGFIVRVITHYLRKENYDITVDSNVMTIVKHSDDPWNGFNEFVAKKDGVYNYIERAMGSYELTKRISCRSLEVSSFVMMAYFVSCCIKHKEELDYNELLIKREIRTSLDDVLKETKAEYKGQYFIDEIKKVFE